MADEAYLSHVEAAGNLMMQAEAREGHLAATKALKRKLKVDPVAVALAALHPSHICKPIPGLACMFSMVAIKPSNTSGLGAVALFLWACIRQVGRLSATLCVTKLVMVKSGRHNYSASTTCTS